MRHDVDNIEFWKKRIEEMPERRCSVYITHPSDWEHLNKVHEEILKKECSGRVLDAGCGYGRWSSLFEDYVGVDFSPDFLKIAETLYPSKQFIRANLKSLPFKDGEFDCAFCVSIKQMIKNQSNENWDDMEKEILRVAKKLVILEYPNPEKYDVLRSTHN